MASSLFYRLGFVVFVVGLWLRLAYGTCVVACALLLHPTVSGVRCGRACSGLGFGCVPPLLGRCWGGRVLVRLSRLSPNRFSFGLGCWFFLFLRGVCLCVLGVPFPVGRCSWLGVAGFGWVVPLCPFGGPALGAFWVGGLAVSCGVGGRFGGCGPFSSPPPSPPVFFWGGVCLFLPLPSLGWRTHWPAFSVVFRVAVGGCVPFGRVQAPWVGWVMYTLGSAPLPAGLGPGSAGWAAASGGFVWLWVRGLGLSVSNLLRGAGFNFLGGPPPWLPGVRWPRVWSVVPVCGVLVRHLPGCAVACFG